MRFFILLLATGLFSVMAADQLPDDEKYFTARDVFELELAADPQISPNGQFVVYQRNRMDIMTDRRYRELWIVNADGTGHRPLVQKQSASNPRWSPDGQSLLYVSDGQLNLRWMDTGQTNVLTSVTEGPGNAVWSPDGKWIVFSMFVPAKSRFPVTMPAKPEGAKWADPPVVIDKIRYRRDGGSGFVEEGYSHLFLLSVDGGTPRRLTFGDYHYGGQVSWTPDGKAIIFSANLHENHEYDTNNSEIHRLDLASGKLTTLTDRQGPDRSPRVSPDGSKIAWLGFDDRYQGYQITRLYVMDIDGGNKRLISGDLDRSIESPVWGSDSKGLHCAYEDFGVMTLAHINLSGSVKQLAGDMGGDTLGRPYNGGSFSVAKDGRIAYTLSRPDRPADLVLLEKDHKTTRRLTALNEDLLSHKTLGKVEEIRYKSSHDQRDIQGWIIYPPNFDPAQKYPLLLEIHGGPFAMYGPCFSPELQLFAQLGYMVLYTNPRGSTGYGEAFGNLIHHNYPGQDYDDLMSGVDAVIAKGSVDDRNLFVTGGSGGGVLTSWIVGSTDRFRAAVVAKPVINWYSFVLTADMGAFFHKYWFPGKPWDHLEHYHKRSPISRVKNVKTPTMLLTGEADYRTPMSETEQYYQALKLQKVDTIMVRVPDASHSITRRPSNLAAKVAYIHAWFDKYRVE